MKGISLVNRFEITTLYYNDIQIVARLVINRHRSASSPINPYVEAANILKRVKHRNELTYTQDGQVNIYLNRDELWALNTAIDDLLTAPSPDISAEKLNLLQNYLRQFNK